MFDSKEPEYVSKSRKKGPCRRGRKASMSTYLHRPVSAGRQQLESLPPFHLLTPPASSLRHAFFVAHGILCQASRSIIQANAQPFASTRSMGIPWSDELDPNELVWYFSYGSNLSAEVFEKRRGVRPRMTRKVVVPEHVLSFAHDGFPYIEPCFATCLPRSELWYDDSDIPDIRGTCRPPSLRAFVPSTVPFV